jgi:hypothetical protein
MNSLDGPVSSSLRNLLDGVDDIHSFDNITEDDLNIALYIVRLCTSATDYDGRRLTCFPSNQLVIAVVMKN